MSKAAVSTPQGASAAPWPPALAPATRSLERPLVLAAHLLLLLWREVVLHKRSSETVAKSQWESHQTAPGLSTKLALVDGMHALPAHGHGCRQSGAEGARGC